MTITRALGLSGAGARVVLWGKVLVPVGGSAALPSSAPPPPPPPQATSPRLPRLASAAARRRKNRRSIMVGSCSAHGGQVLRQLAQLGIGVAERVFGHDAVALLAVAELDQLARSEEH